MLLIGCLFLPASDLLPQTSSLRPVVRGIKVQGNLRVPIATILHYVSAAPDRGYDEAATRGDLRRLFDLGLFQSLEIETQEVGEGQVDVIYRVCELPFVSEFLIEGVGEAQQEQIRRLLERDKRVVRSAEPFRPGAANRTANVVRGWLNERKYPFPEVGVLTEEERPGTVRVRLSIHTGPRLDVGEIRFSGNHSIAAGELRKQMNYTRQALLPIRWLNRTAYTAPTFATDLESLRRIYQSRGFAAVRIGRPQIAAREFPSRRWLPVPGFCGTEQKLAFLIPITEGPFYRLATLRTEGSAKFADADVSDIVASIPAPGPYDLLQLHAGRQKIVDALGHHGYALARVELEQSLNDEERTVAAVYRIVAGDPVAIGRIRFEGNARIKEKFLRRELKAHEGEIFDSVKLDQSIRRINKISIVKELKRADAVLEMNEKTGHLDIAIRVKEKDRQGIYGAGGTGGVGGGYLGILYTAFDLFGLGESLTLQLDGGASRSNLLLDIVGARFLGFPFTLSLSVFHRLTDYNVASLVPDATDPIQILKHRSTGLGLSGAYPVADRVQVGLGAQSARISLPQEASGGVPAQVTVENRMDLTPFLLSDSTQGTGPGMRGARLALSQSWSGTSLVKSVDSSARTFRFSQFLGDPITRGENAIAFGFQGSAMRPRKERPLSLDRRFFPGDETVRGFPRGGLTPWAHPSKGGSPPAPVGADTVLGFSLEYRIPIQGPLSSAAFVDLGWSRLSARNVDADTGSRLIEATNRILRGSAGGELRLQLPVIRQPGRLISSWNFLRLNDAILSGGSLFRLANPRATIRFALGDRF